MRRRRVSVMPSLPKSNAAAVVQTYATTFVRRRKRQCVVYARSVCVSVFIIIIKCFVASSRILIFSTPSASVDVVCVCIYLFVCPPVCLSDSVWHTIYIFHSMFGKDRYVIQIMAISPFQHVHISSLVLFSGKKKLFARVQCRFYPEFRKIILKTHLFATLTSHCTLRSLNITYGVG